MRARDTVTFYLPDKLRMQAMAGRHNFIAQVVAVLTGAGLHVAWDHDDDLARLRAIARAGRGLFWMDAPANARGLTLRQTYIAPFWHIEKQAERWLWPVAQAEFDSASIDARKARNFARFWRKRLFGDAPDHARRDGFIYVPLQGQITQHRSFQRASPLAMLQKVLDNAGDRQVVATLHPNVQYEKTEIQAFQGIADGDDRLLIADRTSPRYLQNCDCIVTQNSSVGFKGLFFGKPLILFAKADFHHIALDGMTPGAFAAAEHHHPAYAEYLYWFLQLQSINAGRAEAKDRIAAALRGQGWPV